MPDKIVGKDINIYDIIETIVSRPESLALLTERWTGVALSLKTEMELVKTLQRRNLLEQDFSTKELLFELLLDWQERAKDEATIEELRRVWEENGMRTYSEALTLRFGRSSSPTSSSDSDFEKQWAHIEKHLHELIWITKLYTIIIAQLQARDVLSDGDIALLESITNNVEKKIEFYKMIQNTPGSYEILIQTMESVSQMEVVNLLKRWNF